MMVSVAEETLKKRILVIEDEPDIVRGLRDALEFEGFEVLARGTGAEGLAAAHGVLARVDLPGADRERLLAVADHARLAAEDRVDPRDQLGDRERLGDVVVGAGVEAADLVALLRLGGQDDDRDGLVALAQRLAHPVACLLYTSDAA